jgi:BlaI family transcriptional regulator, penicillinase repressor
LGFIKRAVYGERHFVENARKLADLGCQESLYLLKISPMTETANENRGEVALSRRERQLMDVVYRLGRVTARQVMGELPDAPGYSTVRTLMGVLVRKGWLRTGREGKALVYEAVNGQAVVAQSALRRVVETFFHGSVVHAVSGLLDLRGRPLDADEVARLEELIAESKNDPRQ